MRIEGKELPFKAHRDMVIRMSKQFVDHKKGIPEWLKNANDSYYRFEKNSKDCSKLPIIINFSKKDVSCLDFGGADGEIIKEFGLNYGDPTAAKQGKNEDINIEGGHGNGGKYYGLAQFESCELIMYHNGRYSKFIITNDQDYECSLNEDISPIRALSFVDFSNWNYWYVDKDPLLDRIRNGELGFFCWRGINPKDTNKITDKKLFYNLINSIAYNKQAYNTIRERQVIVLKNGKLYLEELEVPEIEIDEKYSEGWSFDLPNNLSNHEFNKNEVSKLKINVSSKVFSGDVSDLNCLEISSGKQIVASYNISSLTGNKGIAKSLYATITCPELKEYGSVDNDRTNLIDNELSREFKSWCQNKISAVILEIEEKEKKETNEKDLRKISNFLNKIMDVVSDILEEDDLVKFEQDKNSDNHTIMEIPSGEDPWYGTKDNQIINPGSGRRKGSPEESDVSVKKVKGKNRIKILLSNVDKDPLNPGKSYDLTERYPVLSQRNDDIEHGIWWLNTQKKYLSNFKEQNPRTTPFFLFIIKEVVFSHRSRKKFTSKIYNPDAVESENFELIDTIFSRVADKLNLDISDSEDSIAGQIRKFILEKGDFYIKDIVSEFNVSAGYVHTILSQNKHYVDSNYVIEKQNNINHYIKKT